MLQLNVVLSEDYDEGSQEFVVETWPLKLEHSLVSLSKWESKHEKPFLSSDEKTVEEILDYIQLMDLDETPPEIFQKLSDEQYLAVNEYINAKMTATWFHEIKKSKINRQTITSELIYYWMTSYQIPWVAETWHLNRLFTLIKVFGAEASAHDKTNNVGKDNLASQRRALNEQRKRELETSG